MKVIGWGLQAAHIALPLSPVLILGDQAEIWVSKENWNGEHAKIARAKRQMKYEDLVTVELPRQTPTT